MNYVRLTKLKISNLGPIGDDAVDLELSTYFVGRNNAGKSHYLKAVELLLASKDPAFTEIQLLQRNVDAPIIIDGWFVNVEPYLGLLAASKHDKAVEGLIRDGILHVRRILTPKKETGKQYFGIVDEGDQIANPTGLKSAFLQVLPETILIKATADTAQELKTTGNTAINKLKQEVLVSFIKDLSEEAKKAFAGIDIFLHAPDDPKRSQALIDFENALQEEFQGEFVDIIPHVKFELPDEDLIAKNMKIFLDDGFHTSEVERKGHGLQRATLVALLRVLAKHGKRYEHRPAPIFLIGEIETFLHPFAQKLLADALTELGSRYQILTSTHSPFLITPTNVRGYRRVVKNSQAGSKSTAPIWDEVDSIQVERHLRNRGNLEGLFADRVVIVEGKHDEAFYPVAARALGVEMPKKLFTLFVRAGGRKSGIEVRRFYKQMGLDRASLILDLDTIFSNYCNVLFKDLGMDETLVNSLRKSIFWSEERDPKLDEIRDLIKRHGEPKDLQTTLTELRTHSVFVLEHGAVEDYYAIEDPIKKSWEQVQVAADLKHGEFLRELLMKAVGDLPSA